MKWLDQEFENYAMHHQNTLNIRCHEIGVPLIVFSIFGFLSQLNAVPMVPEIDGGMALILIASIALILQEWRLALPVTMTLFGLYFLAKATPSALLAFAFVGGWVLQVLGHWGFEKNRPAFLTQVTHLWVGPIWLFARWVGYVDDRPVDRVERAD
jgi:uncharacterized membrane protein YGL010W